eukprot:1000249_1
MNTIRTLRQSVCLEPINLNVMMTGTGEKSGHPKKMTLAGEKSVNPNKMTGEKSGHPNKMTLAQRISKVFGDMEWSIDVCWFTYVYFVEGMFNTLWSLSTIYLTVFQDISVAQAGFVTSITFIPNALRIPIGIVSDKYNFCGLGHRKPYIAIGGAMCTVMLLILAYIDSISHQLTRPTFLAVYSLATMVMMFFYQVFDGVLDGLIVDTIKNCTAGRLQGIINVSRGVALTICFVVFGAIAENSTWSVIFIILGVFFLTTLVYLPRVTEVEAGTYDPFSWQTFRVFREKYMAALSLCYFLLTIGTSLSLFAIQIFPG